jgi:hypothetical protein
VYQYRFNMADDAKRESTQEYFYKDVTSFKTSTDSTEGDVFGMKQTVEQERFVVIVPGDHFVCSMSKTQDEDGLEEIIQAMKQKLREKKG